MDRSRPGTGEAGARGAGESPPRAGRWRAGARRAASAIRRWPAEHLTALALAALVVGLTAVQAMPIGATDTSIVAGAPSPADIVAPASLRLESDRLTEQARQAAADAVAPRYGEKDGSIVVAQVRSVREVLRVIEVHLQDTERDREDIRASIAGIPEMAEIRPEVIDALMALDETTWAIVRDEVPRVIQLSMRQPVRPDTLAMARSNAITNVDRNLSPETVDLIAALAARFVVPNSVVDEEATEAAREQAREAVAPVIRTIAQGEMIVRAGELVDERDLEVLAAFDMLGTESSWRDLASQLALAMALAGAAALVLYRLRSASDQAWPRGIVVAIALVLAFALAARVVVAEGVVLAFAFPTAAVAMTLSVLFGPEIGVVAALVLAGAIGAMAGGRLDLAVYTIAGGLAGASAIGRVERLKAFLVAGGAVLAANSLVLVAFRSGDPDLDLRGVLELAGAAATNAALATGLTTLGVLAAGSLFGVLTSLQLLELARPDHPLLRKLQTKAPGTYQHSIVLSNLAERAAQAVGADPLLVRVGAYYHDVGKVIRPHFFVENQLGGRNPHVNIEPRRSARIIIDHVPEGAALAREHDLPESIVAFILEHHGTLRAEYFYRAALEAEGGDAAAVDESLYRYPGPRPRSRETAIVMLADGSEAAVRAAGNVSRDTIEAIVGGIIEARVAAGQLDRCDLTLRDLAQIRSEFAKALQSLYHPRIAYPDLPETSDVPRTEAGVPSGRDGEAGAPSPSGASTGAPVGPSS